MRLRKKHFAIPEMQENPYVYFETQGLKDSWQEIFGNNNPIRIELGGGKGQFISILSQKNPNYNYVTFDRETNAFIYAGRKIEALENKNVRAVAIDIEQVGECFKENTIDKIYINFCNPWPKERHKKRRLTHPRFLKEYKKFLKIGGTIELKVDDRDLFLESIKYFEENGFEPVEKTLDMKMEDYPDNIVTEYESKWRKMNKPICFGIFKRIK